MIHVTATRLGVVMRPKCWIFNRPYFMNILSMAYKMQHAVKICLSINSVSHDIRQTAISTAIWWNDLWGFIIPWYFWTGRVCQILIFHRRSNLPVNQMSKFWFNTFTDKWFYIRKHNFNFYFAFSCILSNFRWFRPVLLNRMLFIF